MKLFIILLCIILVLCVIFIDFVSTSDDSPLGLVVKGDLVFVSSFSCTEDIVLENEDI
jgi:hypothetical protein